MSLSRTEERIVHGNRRIKRHNCQLPSYAPAAVVLDSVGRFTSCQSRDWRRIRALVLACPGGMRACLAGTGARVRPDRHNETIGRGCDLVCPRQNSAVIVRARDPSCVVMNERSGAIGGPRAATEPGCGAEPHLDKNADAVVLAVRHDQAVGRDADAVRPGHTAEPGIAIWTVTAFAGADHRLDST